MSSFLSAAENVAGNVKTFGAILKKMEEENTIAVELALEGHSLFVSSQCDTGKVCNSKINIF